MGTPTVLLIEDEPALVEGLRYSLEREELAVVVATDGQQGLQLFERERPDLVLLDVMLPCLDGIEVCRRMRQQQFRGPILMLTSRSEEMDCVAGLEVGADDYVTKPFRTRELVARIRAHLRRSARQRDSAIIEVDGLTLDPERREVRRGEEKLELAPREFELMLYLAQNPDRVLTHQTLIEQVWGYSFGDTSLVTVAVGRLREKIRPSRCIVTVRGSGYMLDTR